MMGPSAIGAQPPPEDMDEEWLLILYSYVNIQYCSYCLRHYCCNCSTGHGIEEMDWNQCDSCGKPIYDEDEA